MLFCLGLIAILLYDSVVANEAVCNQTYTTSPGQIIAKSLQNGSTQCDFYIQAPSDFNITLSFTSFYGFGSLILDNRGTFCLPKIKIVQVDLRLGTKSDMDIICSEYNNSNAPKVFHYQSQLLKLSFIWSRDQSSGFLLQFDFQQNQVGPCEFTCTDNKCLSSWSLVCNGIHDCLDHSDEQDCYQSSGGAISQSKAGVYYVSSIQIIIIVIAVVLSLGVIVCVVSHYKMGARSWSERRTRHNQTHQRHNEDATTSTVLYVPTSTQDRFEREAALHRERNIRLHSIRTDMQLDLPPSISLPDGEELYNSSSLPVHLRNVEQESEIYRECVRPPPNRTVFEGESPPPYRSNSVGVLSVNRNKGTPPRIVRDLNGTPHVMRCYSMGHHGNTRNPFTLQSLHCSGHLPLLNSADSLDPPPDYSEVVANPVIFSRQLPLDSDV